MDDTTPFSSGYNSKKLMETVQYDCITLVEWFLDNYLTLNANEYHPLASGNKNEAKQK